MCPEYSISTDLLMEDTLGIVSLLQTRSLMSLSLISQAKIEGHSILYLITALGKLKFPHPM